MSDGARQIWDRLAPELEGKGLLAPRYAYTLGVLCESLLNWQRCAQLMAVAGPIIQRDGGLVPNPASREFARYANQVRAYAGDFGLTPGAVPSMAWLTEPPELGRR